MGIKISTVQYRQDAEAFEEEIDAKCAVMEYCADVENLPAHAFSVRKYHDGYYVMVDIGNGIFRWLNH